MPPRVVVVVLIAVCTVAITILLAALPANACEEKRAMMHAEKPQFEAEPGELLVTFAGDATPESIKQINDKLGVVVVNSMFDGRIQQVRVPTGVSVEALKAAYASHKEVLSVEPNYRVRIK